MTENIIDEQVDEESGVLQRIIDAVNNGDGLDNEDARHLASLVLYMDQSMNTLDQSLGVVLNLLTQIPNHSGDAIWKSLNLRDLNHRKTVKAILQSHVSIIMEAARESLAPSFERVEESE